MSAKNISNTLQVGRYWGPSASSKTSLNSRSWKIIFLIAGFITAGGVLPGIIDPSNGLLEFTDHAIQDHYAIYFFRSLWITVFIFGIGFFVTALKPTNHIGIVMMGLLGKLLFASNVLVQYANEKVSQMALTAAIVDLIFVLLFGLFIFKYYAIE